MSAKKKNKKRASKRIWDPDSGRNRQKINGVTQTDPDSRANQGQFSLIEGEYYVVDDFGISNHKDYGRVKFDFDDYNKATKKGSGDAEA
jgi:hypothetical protein